MLVTVRMRAAEVYVVIMMVLERAMTRVEEMVVLVNLEREEDVNELVMRAGLQW